MGKRKVGIMGGTFDPIHVGHLILAENAYHQFGLDEVLVMPSGNPPHKTNRDGRASLEDRIEMVRLAIADNPHFTISLAEAHEEGYTYTKETLERLTRQNPDTEYYFIMGADSLFSFEEWKDPKRITELAVIVTAVRDHASAEAIEQQIAHLKNIYEADIRTLETPNMDISSRMLRGWIKEERSVRYYLTDSVISYIEKKGLYRESI
ncbi:MAG: nicotinate-nucleotide adenylyltransferase [Muricoprocola sp.]